jgi:hypothetical protein
VLSVETIGEFVTNCAAESTKQANVMTIRSARIYRGLIWRGTSEATQARSRRIRYARELRASSKLRPLSKCRNRMSRRQYARRDMVHGSSGLDLNLPLRRIIDPKPRHNKVSCRGMNGTEPPVIAISSWGRAPPTTRVSTAMITKPLGSNVMNDVSVVL